MKKLLAVLLLAGSVQGVCAQETKCAEHNTLFEEITGIKKKTDKFNFYLNMNGSFDSEFNDGFEQGKFNMRQLRIEAKGNINNWANNIPLLQNNALIQNLKSSKKRLSKAKSFCSSGGRT